MTNDLPIWNIRVAVIDLVPAATAIDAIRLLRDRIYNDGYELADIIRDDQAFESEPLGPEVDRYVRDRWSGA